MPLATVVFLASACGDDKAPAEPAASGSASAGAGVLGAMNPAEGDPIKIGMVSDGKYPAADASIEGRVADATVKWINERQGGLGGRPIQLVKCEDLGDPAKAADCGNRMVEENVAAVVMGGPAYPDPIWQPLHDSHIPMFFYGVSSAKVLADPASHTFSDPVFSVVGMPADLAKEKGAKKVSAIVIDIPAAVDIYRTQAPAVYRAAGVDFELVTVPPDQADMTPQAQRIATDGTGVVFVVGGEAFCTAAFNALSTVGYKGITASITQCLGDSTRKAVSGSFLKGMTIGAAAPIGTDDPSFTLFKTVSATYGHDIDTGNGTAIGMFTSMAGFREALEGISANDLTPAGIETAIRKMPEKDLPGAGGVRFRCNGKANPALPAVCVRGGLTTILDEKGQPTSYKPLGQSPIED
ncbi:ABC transporter substrate-binding protein [Pseudofrankia asymbiotica]|uniref:ABC transporter substrate-binding protein n=1 Tax=Pseudofrankia asymbiotica TaxID=1834516 RepID=UPI001F518445|nr:ABC transporter substrate-binding protein [Pseudofrankia asymbiotica]